MPFNLSHVFGAALDAMVVGLRRAIATLGDPTAAAPRAVPVFARLHNRRSAPRGRF
jgi:hypothetical protein